MSLLFANGGAKKTKTKSKKKKSSQKASMLTGKLRPPVDVRSQTSIGAFEDLLGHGPITIILVYADWCGACTRFKENTWNDIVTMPPNQRTVNIAAVREDMLPLTSISDAKIDGYPSLLLVGKDKKPAEFISESGQATNALPNNEKENIMKILTAPMPKSINNPPVPNNLRDLPTANSENVLVTTNSLKVTAPKSRNSKNLLSGINMNNSTVINESPLPPNMTADLSVAVNDAEVRSQMPGSMPGTMRGTKQMGGSCSACQMPQLGGARTMKKRKGGLYSALIGIAEKGLPAALLVGLASKKSKKSKKRTRKHKK